MSAAVFGGPRTLSLQRDSEGHRTYTVSHIVATTDPDDGPAVVLTATGLPAIGDQWLFGNDVDGWARCYPDATISIHQEKEGDPTVWWKVEQKFSTKPLKRCQDTSIEDPLDEPQKISGSFVRKTIEAVKDRYGNAIKSSSHEMFRGPQVEFDHNEPQVVIEQNVADLELTLITSMIDTLNDATLWGLAARRIKLSNVSWERKLYGTCSYYYTRKFEFDIRYNGFDRKILDEGTKVLNGHWHRGVGTAGPGTGTGDTMWVLDNINGAPPNQYNPQHFIRFKDLRGENARVILDGSGQPLSNGDQPVYKDVDYYHESNFSAIGIPTSL